MVSNSDHTSSSGESGVDGEEFGGSSAGPITKRGGNNNIHSRKPAALTGSQTRSVDRPIGAGDVIGESSMSVSMNSSVGKVMMQGSVPDRIRDHSFASEIADKARMNTAMPSPSSIGGDAVSVAAKADRRKLKAEKSKERDKAKSRKKRKQLEGKDDGAAESNEGEAPPTSGETITSGGYTVGGTAIAGMAEMRKKKGKKKKDKLARAEKGISPIGSNPNRRLPTASSRDAKKKKERSSPTPAIAKSSSVTSEAAGHSNGGSPNSSPGAAANGFSAQQAAVNDMMRRALEEDQYSALGSVVDTESSEDEDTHAAMYLMRVNSNNHAASMNRPKRQAAIGGPGGLDQSKSWTTPTKIDRNSILAAMRKHMRIEGTKTVHNFDGAAFLEDAEECFENGRTRSLSPTPADEPVEEDHRSNGRGGKRKKKKKGKRGGNRQHHHAVSNDAYVTSHDTVTPASGEEDYHVDGVESGTMDPSDNDDNPDHVTEEDESSIFAQTSGSANATWVECDRCKKWRRLRGVVDARKLPSRWYCSMNKNDPDRSKCSAPEEEYDAANTPESAMDQRTRKHLRLWVRRLHCNEAYEVRHNIGARGKKRGSVVSKEPYEWIRCCNPSCGKWRMLLRSMDSASVFDKCKDGEWFCVMNTWDEKSASCGAAQENLPSVGCPPWVMTEKE